jgi:hypothetical protein
VSNLSKITGHSSLLGYLKDNSIRVWLSNLKTIPKLLAVLEGEYIVQGDKNGGYLLFDDVRIGYDANNNIDELSFYFWQYPELRFKEPLKKTSQNITISRKTKVHDFIRYLNANDVNWKAKGNGEYVIYLQVNKDWYPIFDIDNGELAKIVMPIPGTRFKI